jgi:hypothetical protein
MFINILYDNIMNIIFIALTSLQIILIIRFYGLLLSKKISFSKKQNIAS